VLLILFVSLLLPSFVFCHDYVKQLFLSFPDAVSRELIFVVGKSNKSKNSNDAEVIEDAFCHLLTIALQSMFTSNREL
jgi:hypothetical protein